MVAKQNVEYGYSCRVFTAQYLILLFSLSAVSHAIDAKCSACYAIADELEYKLKKEKARKDSIKSLGGMDQHGKRKVVREVSYDMSELRIIELLEGFCSEMTTYSKSSAKVSRDDPEGNEIGREMEIPYWQKVAIGNDLVVDGAITLGMSNDYEQHELKIYCERIIEEFEDDITELIRHQGNRELIGEALCTKLSKACRGEGGHLERKRRSSDPKLTTKNWKEEL